MELVNVALLDSKYIAVNNENSEQLENFATLVVYYGTLSCNHFKFKLLSLVINIHKHHYLGNRLVSKFAGTVAFGRVMNRSKRNS